MRVVAPTAIGTDGVAVTSVITSLTVAVPDDGDPPAGVTVSVSVTVGVVTGVPTFNVSGITRW
jgi:hypothetical protein